MVKKMQIHKNGVMALQVKFFENLLSHKKTPSAKTGLCSMVQSTHFGLKT